MNKLYLILIMALLILCSLISAGDDIDTGLAVYWSHETTPTTLVDIFGTNDSLSTDAEERDNTNPINNFYWNYSSEPDASTGDSTLIPNSAIAGMRTISIWAFFGLDSTIEVRSIFSTDGASNKISIFNGELTFRIKDSGGEKTCTTTDANIGLGKWYHLVMSINSTDGNMVGYVNATAKCSVAISGTIIPVTSFRFGSDGAGTALFFDGYLDEIAISRNEWSASNVSFAYNLGVGRFCTGDPCAFVAAPVSETETPTIVPPSPEDNSLNITNVTINVTHSTVANDVRYYLYFNTSTPLTESDLIFNNVTRNGSEYSAWTTNAIDGTYFWKWRVQNITDGVFSTNTTERTWTLDSASPALVTVFVNDSFIFNKNLTGQFNFSDNIGLHSINVSIGNITIFNISNINSVAYILNLSYNISNLSTGQYDLGIKWSDGHTSNKLGGDYDVSNGLFNDYLRYGFYDQGYIKTELKSKSILDEWSSEKRKDRYMQILEPATPSDTIVLIEESDMPIHIAYKEGSYNDYWIIMGNHWKDYVLEGETNIQVSINIINDHKVEVTIRGIKNKDRLIFNSVGDLNIVTREYSFYRVNMTETFDALITEGFTFNLDLDVDFGNIEFDISGITPVAILQWNNTNFTSTLVSFDSTAASFRETLGPITIVKKEEISHNWFFNFSTFTEGYLTTNNISQFASSIDVGVCNETFTNYTILNISYFDEVDGTHIDVTNAYQLAIFDGTFFYNQTGSFVNNFTSTFCTNLNPLDVTYNWDMWGIFTLSKSAYITRVLDIDEGVPIALSNNPQTNLSLFLITTLNSSTMTYTWQTTGFQPIDGTMRIFRCNDDGSQDLIESTPIISGEATANIQLLLQTYSYDVIIDGIVFRDLESYTRCHVESTTERTFFVEVDPIDIAPLIGLAGIICILEESAINNTITMSWTTNPEQEGYVSGCIVADRRTIRGSVIILDNCSVESDGFTRTLAIPVVAGNNYIVRGRLEQSNNTIMCDDTVILNPGQAEGGLFGVAGLLAALFLVASLVLIYASDGEFMLAGGAIGLIVSWFLGILVFDWIVVSGIIFFFGLIAVTGRYTRKK